MERKLQEIKQLATFQYELENTLKKRLKLKINDNRSTMVSVRWDPDCTRVSMHRMFLEAPQNVMDALACYIRRDTDGIGPTVRAYIDDNVKKLDYSHELDQNKLITQGKVYDLREIYNQINNDYFGAEIDLNITWYGNSSARAKQRITFGLYQDSLKLVKIHRLLDSNKFPDYIVSYVVYHEMLHYVCPSYYDQKGLHRIHSREFKEREEQFKNYDRVQHWIDTHREYLFD